ncbi:MAG: hypothetical protein IIV77_02950, partial [Bacteroidaceae bacterium]|nr:hypothetical protein [Bacteroidaceae bacterium]
MTELDAVIRVREQQETGSVRVHVPSREVLLFLSEVFRVFEVRGPCQEAECARALHAFLDALALDPDEIQKLVQRTLFLAEEIVTVLEPGHDSATFHFH